MQYDPNATHLPKRNDLPSIEGAPEGAAWFWGQDDEVVEFVHFHVSR